MRVQLPTPCTNMFSMGRSKRENEREKILKSLRRGLFAIDGLCNSNDYPFQGGLICGSVEVPESAPAVLVRGGLHKIDEVLSRYPEVSPTEVRPAVIRIVESASGVEPRPIGGTSPLQCQQSWSSCSPFFTYITNQTAMVSM